MLVGDTENKIQYKKAMKKNPNLTHLACDLGHDIAKTL
jgi:hypothetical protein